MRVFEVLASAVETVGGLEIARLHGMIDVLNIHHLRRMEVHIQVLAGELDPFEFFRKHGEVELGGIESCQVAVHQPRSHFVGHFKEGRAVHQHVIGHSVDLGCLRVNGPLALLHIVPRLDFPGFDALLPAGQNLDETELYD